MYLHVHEKTYKTICAVDFPVDQHAGDQGAGLPGGLHLPGDEVEGLPLHPFWITGGL
jgi:hypothetical protein